jgi:guanylate kinase
MSKIIIVGKSGSGKDYLKKKFTDRGFTTDVSYTNRHKRTGEVENISYHFISTEEFENMIQSGLMYQHDFFNGYYYGTSVQSFKNNNVFIMTPNGVSAIKPEDRKNCVVIFVDINYDIRLNRLMKRADHSKSVERLQSDEEQFKNFLDYDVRITNEDF